MLALPLAALLSLVPSIAALSPKFEGVWEGTPDETTLGPFLRSFDLHIAAVPYGHLISDTLNATEYMIPGSQQQFWVNETTLTYCGIIRHFFPEAARVVTTLEVQADRTNETHYVWCAPVRIGGCHLLQWTLALDETTDTLQSQVLLAEPVVHMHSFFKRTTRKLPTDVQYTPLPPPCTLKEDKDGHSKVRRSGGCPFKNGRLQTPPAPEPVYQALANSPRHQHLAAYEHCYVLNHALDYRMAWDFDEAKQELRMAISAPTNGFVAFGFGMTFPGMNNTDIVLGYKDAQTGADCIRSMFVDDVYVGAPTDNSAMILSQTSIHDDPITHRRTVAFTRPFHTGHHDIPVEYNIPFFVMWATSAPSASPPLTCTTPLGPSYHGPNRGHLTIDFKEPATIFASQNKC